jgi:AraC family transcriptional regulator
MDNQKSIITHIPQLQLSYLFQSDFYEIKNWAFDFLEDRQGLKGFNDCFCLVYVKKGAYLFDYYKDHHDTHSGQMIIEKPNYMYRLRPANGECSIFNFTDAFYQQFIEDLNLKTSFFFANENLLSLTLKASPECEYLHFQILQNLQTIGKLEMDCLVMELLHHIVGIINNEKYAFEIDGALRKFHLPTVEQAKEYIHHHFTDDISLQEISTYSCVSPFHFSRIFKKITGFSPIQYLQSIRLKHSEMLLRNTSLPVTDIALSSGFTTGEYFATVFKQKYKTSPTQFRR